MDPSLIVILLITALPLGVLGLVIFLFMKRCRPCQTSKDLKRRSTNPDDIHDDGDESLELCTDQTELARAIPDSNNESSNLAGQESGEPSGSEAACGDSSVTVSTIKSTIFLLHRTFLHLFNVIHRIPTKNTLYLVLASSRGSYK